MLLSQSVTILNVPYLALLGQFPFIYIAQDFINKILAMVFDRESVSDIAAYTVQRVFDASL